VKSSRNVFRFDTYRKSDGR